MTNAGPLCPTCGRGVDDSKVLDKRNTNSEIYRRRQCRCGGRYTTYEGTVRADNVSAARDEIVGLMRKLVDDQKLLRDAMQTFMKETRQ